MKQQDETSVLRRREGNRKTKNKKVSFLSET
jgi:hypothetical protein